MFAFTFEDESGNTLVEYNDETIDEVYASIDEAISDYASNSSQSDIRQAQDAFKDWDWDESDFYLSIQDDNGNTEHRMKVEQY